MTIDTLVAEYRAAQIALTKAVNESLTKLWKGVESGDIMRSWSRTLPVAWSLLTAAQVRAAMVADPYVTATLQEQDIDPYATGRVNAKTLSGVASDGRPLETLLMEPPIRTLEAIRDGSSVGSALAKGLMQLSLIAQTQIADAGRVAVGVATTARPHAHGYVRMLNPPSCSRCIILAGRWFRWNAGFRRHPGCDCRQIPSNEDVSGDITTTPDAFFRSMSPVEQEKVFGQSGAQAIRDGANMARVVNANRGTYVAGDRKFTREATTRRGRTAGQASGSRLMPETIYSEAHGNREEALRLLRLHGYLV